MASTAILNFQKVLFWTPCHHCISHLVQIGQELAKFSFPVELNCDLYNTVMLMQSKFCLSHCPSVILMLCGRPKKQTADIAVPSSISGCGSVPFHLKFWLKVLHAHIIRLVLVMPQLYKLVKISVITNRKSITVYFPVSSI